MQKIRKTKEPILRSCVASGRTRKQTNRTKFIGHFTLERVSKNTKKSQQLCYINHWLDYYQILTQSLFKTNLRIIINFLQIFYILVCIDFFSIRHVFDRVHKNITDIQTFQHRLNCFWSLFTFRYTQLQIACKIDECFILLL